MEQRRRHKCVWAGSSSIKSRDERLKEHQEFESSDLKKMLDDGWEITKTELKVRRPRIKREPFKLFGVIEAKFEIPIEILIKAKLL